MASIFSHPAVPVGIAIALGQKVIPKKLVLAGVIASVFADLDCIGLPLGIPYESPFGHRGFTHSIVTAFAFAAVCAWCFRQSTGVMSPFAFVFVFAAAMSHPLLDMLTDGGLGIALLWPFSAERLFFPATPIPVSPIGGAFFSARGLHVLLTEMGLIWLPCLLVGGIGLALRACRAQEEPPPP